MELVYASYHLYKAQVGHQSFQNLEVEFQCYALAKGSESPSPSSGSLHPTK